MTPAERANYAIPITSAGHERALLVAHVTEEIKAAVRDALDEQGRILRFTMGMKPGESMTEFLKRRQEEWNKAIREAVRAAYEDAARIADLQAAHPGTNCGCGECTGATSAAAAIRERLKP